jgi:hypothetical protein
MTITSFEDTYNAFGLQVKSELPLPELITSCGVPDVAIRFGRITEALDKPFLSGICFHALPNKFMLKVNGIACYLVENGNSIIIDRDEGGSDDEIRLFLLGSAFGALIHQRGILPVHGSAVVMDNKAIIFSGISGAGKSTLAAAFVHKGYKLLADDVCVVSLDQDDQPQVHPGYPQMKLWNDSLENLGHYPQVLRKIRNGIKKYALPVQAGFHNKTVMLNGIYVIEVQDTNDIKTCNITGIEKFALISRHTYRLNFLKGCGTTEAHFRHTEAIARQCFVKCLYRPSHGFHLEQLMESIENDVTRDPSGFDTLKNIR